MLGLISKSYESYEIKSDILRWDIWAVIPILSVYKQEFILSISIFEHR